MLPIAEQDARRKTSLFKQSLRLHEVAAGVFVQRIAGSYLKRLIKPLREARARAPDPRRFDPQSVDVDRTDPLVAALYAFDDIFEDCNTAKVDMLSSVEYLAEEYDVHGSSGHGCLILAWRQTYNRETRRHDAPQLVGAMTLHRFVQTPSFSTDMSSLSERDFRTLTGPPNFFRKNLIFIDAMCAKGRSGVGRLLLMHAYNYALLRKCTGVIALSFSSRRNVRPQSYPLFEDFGFEAIIADARFRNPRIHGAWFFIDVRNPAPFENLESGALRVCTRRGLTPATRSRLILRC
jgi:hypothetical protein